MLLDMPVQEARALRSLIRDEYSGCGADTADAHHPGLVAADARLAAALGEPDMDWRRVDQ